MLEASQILKVLFLAFLQTITSTDGNDADTFCIIVSVGGGLPASALEETT